MLKLKTIKKSCFDPEMLAAAIADLQSNPTDEPRRVGPHHTMRIVNDEDWNAVHAPMVVHVETLAEFLRNGDIDDVHEVTAMLDLYMVLDSMFGTTFRMMARDIVEKTMKAVEEESAAKQSGQTFMTELNDG